MDEIAELFERAAYETKQGDAEKAVRLDDSNDIYLTIINRDSYYFED